MFYTIYKITNILNGKYYIGMHQTKNLDDGYMGSGKVLRLAIEKYGKHNFVKEILHVFDNEVDMKNKEKELVIISEQTYNLCEGGKGGFGYLNSNGLSSRLGATLSQETKEKLSRAKKGTTLSKETKQKISENNGMKNSDIARKKVSVSLTGKKKTEEHKRKIAEAIKRKYEEKRAAMVFNG